MNKQDEKLYTECEVQALIFASQVKHYNEIERPTELDHDELLVENKQLKKRIAKLENEQMKVIATDADYTRLRQLCQKLEKDKKALQNKIAIMNKRK